jgi:hypothetical protein
MIQRQLKAGGELSHQLLKQKKPETSKPESEEPTPKAAS